MRVKPSVSPREALDRVRDPELPMVSIHELGILRDVIEHPDGRIEVIITPTYSGCPAMDVIRSDVRSELAADGFDDVVVTTVLFPPWTTDWMSDDGRRKLREAGVAPPHVRTGDEPVPLTLGIRAPEVVPCPQCGADGREVSRFASTACKAHYVCTGCGEPFDYFKTI
ncbi:MAG TPA: 1,2-phenylacetyl-CoA epoxidase subunit PaaD [Mycobacterium sp.]|nr:1,2-phenylacetyl-CoA epoxidase subunit PaaD [Mycobacterium sp.]